MDEGPLVQLLFVAVALTLARQTFRPTLIRFVADSTKMGESGCGRCSMLDVSGHISDSEGESSIAEDNAQFSALRLGGLNAFHYPLE